MSGSSKQCRYEDVQERYEGLLRHLTDAGRIHTLTQQFIELKKNTSRVDFAYTLLKEYKHKPLPALIEDGKCDKTATSYRKQGNEHYKLKHNQKAFEHYTRSVAFSENGSENLALAFANRSAVLFEEELYEECLLDIQNALNGRYPDYLKPKLEARREKCLSRTIKDRKSERNQSIPEIPQEQRNKNIQCATNAIEIARDSEQGRHVVAVRDLHIGEVIAVEKSFCNVLLDKFSNHCHECLKICYNLIPCPNCTETMYCSELCKTAAYCYHQYECKVLKTFRLLDEDKLYLLPLKIVLSIKDSFGEISSIEKKSDEVYRSDRYDEIHRLEGNTTKRSVSDLLKRSVIAALIFHVIDTYTSFLATDQERELFKELLLKHITYGNNFHEITEMAANQHGVYEPSELAAGAYSFASMFNHSCCSNILRQSYGPTLVLRAMRSIKKGEQCYENYGCHYELMPKIERRKTMRRKYFFDCRCKPCEEDWPLHQDLPVKQPNIVVLGVFNRDKLEHGDSLYAKEILPKLIELMTKLEEYEPDKTFAYAAVMAGQCFSLLTVVRRLF